MPLTEETRAQVREIIARYPQPRSALLPMLHLMQAEEGYITPHGIELCAEELGITTAEVSAVVTFYSMYKRRPVGDYHVGVCTNTLCAVMGGDVIFAALKEHLGIGNDETTDDGKVTLEHIECNAACDFAPVIMVNWEFFDNQTPENARQLVDDLRAGKQVTPTRGAPLCAFAETSRVLAGFPDPRPDAVAGGGGGGPASLAGLRLARDRGDEAPSMPHQERGRARDGQRRPAPAGAPPAGGRTAEAPPAGSPKPSAHDAPAQTADSDQDRKGE
jgi:NADH-quinone oxidoreductase subunit E